MEDKVKVIKDFINEKISSMESTKDLLLYLSTEVPDEEYNISSDKFHEMYIKNIFKTCIVQSIDVVANHEFAIDEEYIYIFTEIIGKRIPTVMTKFTLDRMLSIIDNIKHDEENNQ